MTAGSYVLVTPARNEESYIEKTLQSVVTQSILPKKWIIVNDGSTDRTEEIVNAYASRYCFIQLLNAPRQGSRNFGSKARAFSAGYRLFRDLEYEFVGNLDADVSFGNDYFEAVIQGFQMNEKLGIAGGIICEQAGEDCLPQNVSLNSCAGAVQMFRRRCYEDIGGYAPLNHGGVDAAAEVMARMKGWEVLTFPEIKVLHHRRVGGASGNIIRTRFRQGKKDYLLGYHPAFYIFSSLYRAIDKPYVVGSFFKVIGYLWAGMTRMERTLPPAFVDYLRREQMDRLRSMFSSKKRLIQTSRTTRN